MSQSTPIADLGQWSVEDLRLTIFYPGNVDTSNLWEQSMGDRPESRDERPREGIVQQQGEAGGNQLLLITRALRLDWTVLPSPATDPGIRATPILADLNQAMSILQRALKKSLRSVRVVHRLAFGASLGQEVPNPSEGMSRLSKYLPRLELEERGVSDFIYQINRRRQSSRVPHAQLNRVARWSVEQIIGGEVRITHAQAPQVQSSTAFTNRLRLDVNTIPETNAIATDRIPGLFDELVEIACRVASEGDVV